MNTILPPDPDGPSAQVSTKAGELHYADFDYAQIGDALEIERGTVSAMLNAAHATLARTLTEEMTI
jgi:hypothetical protein